MSAEIQSEFDAEIELRRGHGGIFDVELNGRMIFSKHELFRMPEAGEIAELIEEQLSR